MNYYKVTAKCGHVGRSHYIIKDFCVKAENGKEAAHKVRYFPRVKHDRKDAIILVTLIDREEFNQIYELHNQDLYFNVSNSSEQRMYGAIDYEQVLEYEKKPERKKKDKDSIFYRKMKRIQFRDLKKRLAEVI